MSLRKLFKRLHQDERGVVSLETVLIIAAVALPVLIIIIKFGWPKIKSYFDTGMNQLERESNNAIQGN
jgi:Flp pilus assembly pilin Flp